MNTLPRDTPAAETQDAAPDAAKSLFAKRLFRAMVNRNWNQAELARRAGLNRAAVNKYISGKSLPSPESLAALAQALNMSPLQLLPPGVDDSPVGPQVNLTGRGNGKVLLSINAEVSMQLALQVLALVQGELGSSAAPSPGLPAGSRSG